MNANQMDEFKGFSLFNDQQEPLRTRNRAVVLSNIAEDHTNKEKKISPKGASIMMGYFSAIPKEERSNAAKMFADEMTRRGFAVVKE